MTMIIKKINSNITVDFGDFQLDFVPNDKNIKTLETIQEKMEEINKMNDSDSIDKLKGNVAEWWKTLFNEEVYNKVYAFSGESTFDSAIYFIQTVKYISSQIEGLAKEDALRKYL